MKKIPPVVGHGMGSEVSHTHCYNPYMSSTLYRGVYLPHYEQPGKIYFITFRLFDSIPETTLSKLRETRDELLSSSEYSEAHDVLLETIEYWLSRGHGECLLQYEETVRIVENALLYHDGVSYDLYDYVIMPNHVHMLIMCEGGVNDIIEGIKRYSSRRINMVMGREGQLWQKDYFDRMIRSVTDFHRFSEYIRDNPKSWGETK